MTPAMAHTERALTEMAKLYIGQLTKIRDKLESVAENIEDKDSMSESDETKADAYRTAVDLIDEAINALEDLG
jgi:hypothetical protein